MVDIFLSSLGHALFGPTLEKSSDRKILSQHYPVYQISTGLKWQPESNITHSVEANILDPSHMGSRPAQRTGQTLERLMGDLLSVNRYPFSSSRSSGVIQYHLSQGMAGIQTEYVEIFKSFPPNNSNGKLHIHPHALHLHCQKDPFSLEIIFNINVN